MFRKPDGKKNIGEPRGPIYWFLVALLAGGAPHYDITMHR